MAFPGLKIRERKLSIRRETVGPRHDPYERRYTTVRENGVDYTFVACALAGDGFQFDDGPILWDFNKLKNGVAQEELAADMFERFTGLTPEDAEHYYHERIEEPEFYLSYYE